ncbi:MULTISPECIES: lytic transglycosylase domain-containing protein [Mesorhizobium]|jgi:soluble lytic murein transglycosylase-like protein|uniref:lytic transglycosylase domain-containing protein n=1 Tax=Mesorhizobium TaxID=68287 RepID=UPI0003CFE91B|nr:transglycosylase SLT domain-containing protein [Mesorhizobium sp.]ESZ20292.1 lytic transglycosylase [Mesorhizobium sp. L48C026A00]RWN99895.1 MAG: lytic transglycosylase domain-containing protein [Mesorhizobium sp.]RWO24701.1 MAG: lytic transglycosylase domain-containing protein [Mesorhizobium sp.]TIL68079.1 MAG: lytic transglycosylase domain-containing protein [Mesorhizobium sp.]TIN09173.1 MAG: lytic transglycosylase domain-containing protein [Mesorhizobium sp.]
MQKLTVLTAAVAAGVMTFAIGAANGAPLSQRADQGFMTASDKTATPKAGQDAGEKRTASAKAKKVAAVKAKKPASAKAEKVSAKKAVVAKKPVLAKKAVSKRHVKRNRTRIDQATTASIGRQSRAAAPKPAAAGDSGQYSTIIERHAASNGVPVSLAKAVIMIESRFQPNQVGRAGEIGLMQIKPSTARMMGYSGSIKGLHDPETNIKYGMKYLAMARNLGDGTTCGTILKYNAGHGAKRMNPISAAYCGKVKVQLAALGAPA